MSSGLDVNSKDFLSKFEHLLSNLRVISSIKENDKLFIDNNNIIIDNHYWLQSLIRWWYSANRQDSLNYINKVIPDVIQLKLNLNDRLYRLRKKLKKAKYRTDTRLTIKSKLIKYIKTINDELKLNIEGLNNFKNTYSDDEEITKSIDNLLDKIKKTIA